MKSFEREPLDRIAPLAEYGVATVHEALGRTGLMATRLRPIFPGSAIVGNAVTVSLAPGDNTMFHVVVELCREGDVLVAAPTSPCTDGYFGELLGSALHARGVRGLIIDAGCRDVAQLKDLPFPVWSRAVSAQGTVKETLGDINRPLVCAEQLVHPGDLIVADDDGVMVVPKARLGEALAASLSRVQKEDANRKRFLSGEVGLDVYGMRDRLAAKGLKYYESADDLEAVRA